MRVENKSLWGKGNLYCLDNKQTEQWKSSITVIPTTNLCNNCNLKVDKGPSLQCHIWESDKGIQGKLQYGIDTEADNEVLLVVLERDFCNR